MHDTNEMKARLEAELVVVTDELHTLGIHNPDVPEDWIATPEPDAGESDPNTEADRVEEWNERRAILADLETRYNNLRRALTKIETGTYGVCELSGGPIEPERLAANPAARTCIAHKDHENELPR